MAIEPPQVIVKLVVFGLSISSSWGNGQATTWRALARGLARSGHRLVFFERDVPYYARHRDLFDVAGGALHLYPTWSDVRELALRELTDADAAIVTSFCPDAREAADAVLGSRARVRVFYDMDSPLTLARLEAGEPVEYVPSSDLRGFDLVLSFAGGPTLRDLAARLGARRVEPLYGCVDPEVHRPVPPRADLASDMSYLGTYAADRHAALEALLVGPARAEPERRFLLVGPLYPPECGFPANVRRLEHLAPDGHAALYASSRVTLSVTRGPMRERGACPSARLFEASACGVPVLSDDWPGMRAFFEPGREILVAETTEEARAVLARDAVELRRIGSRARERVLAQHTGEHRARELVASLERAVTVPAGSRDGLRSEAR